jgi:hypothetical protein
MHAASVPRRKSSVAFLCYSVKLVYGVRQALGRRFHIAPDTAGAPVAGAFHCVVHPLLVGHFAQEHMPKHMVAPLFETYRRFYPTLLYYLISQTGAHESGKQKKR